MQERHVQPLWAKSSVSGISAVRTLKQGSVMCVEIHLIIRWRKIDSRQLLIHSAPVNSFPKTPR